MGPNSLRIYKPTVLEPFQEVFTIGNGSKYRTFGSLVAMAPRHLPLPRNSSSPSDVVFVPFSSGTTGQPKGVMLSNQNIITNILQVW